MFSEKSSVRLIIVLFLCVLCANVIGEAVRFLLQLAAGEGTIVERALLNYVNWPVGPHKLNLIILSFQFELALHFNVITLLGILAGWYYYRYSY